MKEQYISLCECGQKIIGFSEHHLNQNIAIHKRISKEHKERMKLIENIKKYNYTLMFNDMIKEMILNHPVMIEDLKEIGRYQLTEEEKYENMVS